MVFYPCAGLEGSKEKMKRLASTSLNDRLYNLLFQCTTVVAASGSKFSI